jgi:hypothetical protein
MGDVRRIGLLLRSGTKNASQQLSNPTCVTRSARRGDAVARKFLVFRNCEKVKTPTGARCVGGHLPTF